MTSAGSVSTADRYAVLKQAGFNDGQALVMTAISYLECQSCDMSSVNPTGDVGLMQINMQHWGSTDPHQSKYGDLADPVVSARAAFDVFNGAGGQQNPTNGYKAWCTYPGGCNGASPTTESAFNTLVQSLAATISNGPNPSAIVGSPAPGGGTYPAATTTAAPNPCDSIPNWNIAGQSIPGTGGISSAFCYVGNLFQWLSQRGHWWAIALVAAGVGLIVAGLGIYTKPDIARAAKGLI